MLFMYEELKNKMYYRDDPIDDIDGEYVFPKNFKSNRDSTIPAGKWSFWFNTPTTNSSVYTEIIIGSKFKPEMKGTMSFNSKWGYDVDYFHIDEYVISFPVRIDRILIDKSFHFLEEKEYWDGDYRYCPVTHKFGFFDSIEIIDPNSNEIFIEEKENDLLHYTLSRDVLRMFDCTIEDLSKYTIYKQSVFDKTEETYDYN